MQKWLSVVGVSGGESKVWSCKEQYCIEILNVRSMNQGKLVMVKQENARLNIDILGISELKWMGMAIISITAGKKPLEERSCLHSQQKSPKCSFCVQSQKSQNDLSLFPRQIIQCRSNPSLCPNHWCWSWSWSLQWRPTTPSRANTLKRCVFHHRGSECKSRKWKDTLNDRQTWP